MQDHETIFKAFLEQKGLKFTRPRRMILSSIFALHEHFDIEQLYESIRSKSKDVSRATVYRTIPLLVEAGLIQRSLRSETRDTYEHILGHPRHAHWVCKNCGAVLETDMQEIVKLLHQKAKTLNFQIDDISLIINGLCWKCRNAANESQ
ncbi:MAG: Fur family transcriptional regulator [Candidatus Cloacimonadaceae bacterium]